MSSDLHRSTTHAQADPRHDDVAFEHRDVQTRSIYNYLIILAVAVLLTFGVCVYILRFTIGFVSGSDTPPMPARHEMMDKMTPQEREAMPYPPEPRLQGVPGHENDPQQDLREKWKADTEANERTGWIDETTGVAQIPVKDAMKIIAEKGLQGIVVSPAEKKK